MGKLGGIQSDADLVSPHATPPFDAKETGLRPEPRRAEDCGAVEEGDACRGDRRKNAPALDRERLRLHLDLDLHLGLQLGLCLQSFDFRLRLISSFYFSASASFMHSIANCRHLALTENKVSNIGGEVPKVSF